MILEIAQLQIRPGQTADFEAAFAQAQAIIARMKGYVRHELQACVEDNHRYALLVWWDTLENHMVDFRESPAFTEWRTILGPLFAAPPAVVHHEEPL